MVGGFSESPYLKGEILKRFESDKVQVIASLYSLINNFFIGFGPKKTTSLSCERSLYVWIESQINFFKNRQKDLWY